MNMMSKQAKTRCLCMAAAVLFALLLSSAALAVPAFSGRAYTLRQPDGYTFKAARHGDERFHWTTSREDGYIVVYNSETKWWNFAAVKDDKLVDSAVHYRKGAKPPQGATKSYARPKPKPSKDYGS
ncbi:MAG: hypothetical protein Q4F74_07790 [Synergistaceae bacterium]|nr:hypothetical protein [Synergistaceae bacterium]